MPGPEHGRERSLRRVRSFYDRHSNDFLACAGPTFQSALWRPAPGRLEDPAASNLYFAKQAGVGPGMRILDAGCGVGGPALDIAREFSELRIDAVTLSPVQAALARDLVNRAGLEERVRVCVADYHHLPFEEGVFDLVLFFESAGYSVDLAQLSLEVRRVLRPGGVLFVKDVFRQPGSMSEQEQASFARYCTRWGLAGTPSIQEMADAFRAAGLVVEQAASIDSVVGTARFFGSMVDLGAPSGLNAFGRRFWTRDDPPPIHFGQILARKMDPDAVSPDAPLKAEVTARSLEQWVQVVGDRLDAFRRRLGPHLVPAWEALLASRGILDPASHLLMLNPESYPVVQLVVWLAETVTRRGGNVEQETLAELVEASLLGYLHIRVLDDYLDESIGEPGTSMALASALLCRAESLVARQAPASPRFWDWFDTILLTCHDAMLEERETVRGDAPFDEQTHRRLVIARSMPLALPAGALLARAGLWELIPDLERFVGALVIAGQLLDDLHDALSDLGQGNRTWLVRRFGGEQGAGVLLRRLLLEGGLDEVVAEISTAIGQAREVARAMDMLQAETYLDQRAARMAEGQKRVFGALFSRLSGT